MSGHGIYSQSAGGIIDQDGDIAVTGGSAGIYIDSVATQTAIYLRSGEVSATGSTVTIKGNDGAETLDLNGRTLG